MIENIEAPNYKDDEELIEFFDDTPFWSAPFGIKLLDNIRYKKNISALDIGFGTGFPLTEIAMRLGNSCKVYGVETWTNAIKRAEKKINFYGIKNVEIIEGTVEKLPFNDCSIDLITSNNCLNNVDDYEIALEECSRVLKPGGQLIQTMNTSETMQIFYDAFKQSFHEFGLDYEIKHINQHIFKKRKPISEVIQIIENQNFICVKLIDDEFSYKFCDATSMFNHYFFRLAFLDSWKQLVPKDKIVEIFAATEQKLNKKAELEGCLVLNVPFVVIDSVKI